MHKNLLTTQPKYDIIDVESEKQSHNLGGKLNGFIWQEEGS